MQCDSASDTSHFHSCQQQKRTFITARHDLIVRTLQASRAQSPGSMVLNGSGPTWTLPFPSLLLDVAITHPASPSRKSPTPLAAAATAENAKISKYLSCWRVMG